MTFVLRSPTVASAKGGVFGKVFFNIVVSCCRSGEISVASEEEQSSNNGRNNREQGSIQPVFPLGNQSSFAARSSFCLITLHSTSARHFLLPFSLPHLLHLLMPTEQQSQPQSQQTNAGSKQPSKHSHAASQAQPAPRKVRFNVGP